ncbi:MAG: crotonase/enoyl-CoA hydratase family protein [Oligoflexus sp.]
MSVKWQFLDVKLDNRVAEVSLNRPDKSNAVNLEMWQEIRRVFCWADEDPSVRCVVLKAMGKNFCAGIDFAMIQYLSQNFQTQGEGRRQEELRKVIIDLQACFTAIEDCRKPVIAAIHGACYGAGVDLITACDFRYASKDASFSVKEVDLAIVADIGTLQRLPRIVSEGVARELALTARIVASEEAQRLHLVNRVFATPEELWSQASATAAIIAEKSPIAVRGTKQVLNYSRDHSVAEGLDFVANWNAAMLFNRDFQKAVEAAMSRKVAIFDD